MNVSVLALAFTLLAPLCALADGTALLRGTLHAWRDASIIRHGRVTVHSGSDVFSATTDEHGVFRLFGIPPGRALMTLEAAGYSPVSFRFCVHPGEVRALPLRMIEGGSIPQLQAASNYDSAIANGLNASTTSDVYYLSNC